MIITMMDWPDIETALRFEATSIGSDQLGVTSAGQRVHPRCYGTFARILGRLVRERGLFTAAGGHPADERPAGRGARARPTAAGSRRASSRTWCSTTRRRSSTRRRTRRRPSRARGIEWVLLAGSPAVERGDIVRPTSAAWSGAAWRRRRPPDARALVDASGGVDRDQLLDDAIADADVAPAEVADRRRRGSAGSARRRRRRAANPAESSRIPCSSDRRSRLPSNPTGPAVAADHGQALGALVEPEGLRSRVDDRAIRRRAADHRRRDRQRGVGRRRSFRARPGPRRRTRTCPAGSRSRRVRAQRAWPWALTRHSRSGSRSRLPECARPPPGPRPPRPRRSPRPPARSGAPYAWPACVNTPSTVSAGRSATASASAAASAGRTPHRRRPLSISIRTATGRPAAAAARRQSRARPSTLSTPTVSRAREARSHRPGHLRRRRRSRTRRGRRRCRPRSSASASSSLATVMPTAPAAIWRRAISTDLCVLKCGRRSTPRRRATAAISAMFASSRSRSTIRAGVSTAVHGRPSKSASSAASSERDRHRLRTWAG